MTQKAQMTQEQLMVVLRGRISSFKNDWNNMMLIGDQRQADMVDGMKRETESILHMLEDIEVIQEQ